MKNKNKTYKTILKTSDIEIIAEAIKNYHGNYSDVNGSYTGTDTVNPLSPPIQDADDL